MATTAKFLFSKDDEVPSWWNNLNIIPGNGHFSLDVRAESNTLLEELKKNRACHRISCIDGIENFI